MVGEPDLIVDRTHLSRRASGIERITRELFSAEALAPLSVGGWAARGTRPSMVWEQWARMPLAAARRPRTVWIFSGYPPAAPFALAPERSVLYVHDLFLLTRRHELNRAARLYMAPSFALALRRLRHFMTNSRTTAEALRAYIQPDATVLTYRPPIRNVFGLSPRVGGRAGDRPLILGAVGTVEPRKNLLAAARICEALERISDRRVELHVVGRRGWGGDAAALERMPQVRLLGYLGDEEARAAIEGFDALVCTSHDEGLGLPLLEVQFAGLPVIAPDGPVFREVLGESGLFIDPGRPDEAAAAIAEMFKGADWAERAADAASLNLARWNAAAAEDRARVVAFLKARLATLAGRG